jgi:hypothetical protein
MKTRCSGSRLVLWMGLLLGCSASAQKGSEAHRITAHVHSGLGLFLSDFRTLLEAGTSF